MNLKNKLLHIRKELTQKKELECIEKKASIYDKTPIINMSEQRKSYELDDKVDDFIKWYFDNMVKGIYTKTGEYSFPKEMRNFIEKMAVWYELRYTDDEVNKLIPYSSRFENEFNEFVFEKNPYIKKQLESSINDYSSILKNYNWSEFYNKEVFINSLGFNRNYLLTPEWPDIIYMREFDSWSEAHLHLSEDGIVTESEGVHIKDKDLIGMHIKDVYELLKGTGYFSLELEKSIKRYDKEVYQMEEMLNCVMYRIIERGRNRIGPRRAFIFAKEFGRNIDIPLMYGIDLSDPYLDNFVNIYLSEGGSIDLVCFENYGSREKRNDKLQTTTIKEILRLKDSKEESKGPKLLK